MKQFTILLSLFVAMLCTGFAYTGVSAEESPGVDVADVVLTDVVSTPINDGVFVLSVIGNVGIVPTVFDSESFLSVYLEDAGLSNFVPIHFYSWFDIDKKALKTFGGINC